MCTSTFGVHRLLHPAVMERCDLWPIHQRSPGVLGLLNRLAELTAGGTIFSKLINKKRTKMEGLTQHSAVCSERQLTNISANTQVCISVYASVHC